MSDISKLWLTVLSNYEDNHLGKIRLISCLSYIQSDEVNYFRH